MCAVTRGLGFTLVELVIGVSVISGILAAAYVCLHTGLTGQDDLLLRREAGQCARAALSLLAADLRAACPLGEDMEFVGMDRELAGMEADNIDFATRNWTPRGPGEGGSTEVSWYVDRSFEMDGFALWRRRDPTPDREPLDGGFREEIASGIASFRVEYSDGFIWYDEWGSAEESDRMGTIEASAWNSSGLPEAVRITLAFHAKPLAVPAPGEKSAGETPPPEAPEGKDLAGESDAPKAGEEKALERGLDGPPRPGDPVAKEAKPPRPLTFRTVVRLNLAATYGAGGTRASGGEEEGSGDGSGDASAPAAESSSGGEVSGGGS